MAYLLLLPIGLYIALAAAAFQRRPLSGVTLALVAYVCCATVATAGYLVLGTTPDRHTAEIAALVVIFPAAWSYMTLLPLTLLGLYFENWYNLHRQRLAVIAALWTLLVSAILIGLCADQRHSLVLPVTSHAWMHWLLAKNFYYWPRNALILLGTQVAYFPIIAAAVYRRRVTLWRGAVPLTLVVLLTMLIPLLAPLAGAQGLVTITALKFVPVVLLLTALLVQGRRAITLDELIQTTLRMRSDGMAVLDARQRVVWRNVQMTRWLDKTLANTMSPPYIDELLGATPFLPVVREMLEKGAPQGECQLALDGEEHVLQVELQPVQNLRSLPGAQLLVLHDITASRVRRNLEERRRELLALSAISADIVSSLDLEQVIVRALQQVLAATTAEGVAVYLVDEQHPELLRLAGNRVSSPEVTPAPDPLLIESTMVGYVIRAHQTLLVPNAERDAQHGPRLMALGFKAGVTIPLITRDQVIGAIQVAYHAPHEFDPIQVALVESVGRQIAIAIDNARLYRQEHEQHRVTEVLRQIASIVATKKLDEALALMLSQLREVISYDRATVLLLTDPDRLRIGASVGFVASPDDPPVQEVRIEINKFTYLERLFSQRVPQIVSDTAADPLWKKDQYGYNSWMGVPILVRSQMVGCLSLSHQAAGRFTAQALQIAITFADQAAVVVENARLFETEEQRRVQAELLQKASYELVTSRSLESALTSALVNLAQVIEFDRARVGLINESQQAWAAHASYPPGKYALPAQSISINAYPLLQQIVKEKSPILIHDSRENPLWRQGPADLPEVRSWMGLPLVVRDRIVGILNIHRFQPHGFSEDQFQIARTFAHQVAAALENFRLLDEASRQNRILSVQNIILSTSSESLTHDNLLGVLLEQVLEMLGLTGGVIHQYYADARELRLRASSGLPETLIDRLDHLPAASLLEAALPDLSLPGARGYSFLSVPLVSHRIGIGLLSVGVSGGESFDPNLKSLMSNIGQQLGVVMDNAILFEEARRRVALSTNLGRLSLAISAQLDRNAVLELICRESIGVFDVQGTYIWLVEKDQLIGVSACGLGSDRFTGYVLDRQEMALLPARALADWRPRYVHRVDESQALPAEFLEMTHARSAIAVPLIKADVPIGVLLLISTQNAYAFGDWLTEQIGLFGVQTALAIQNAGLFEEVRHRLDQIRLVNEVGRYATAILAPVMLVDGVARQIYGLLNYDTISVLQVEEGQLRIKAVFVRGQPFAVDLAAERYRSLTSVAVQAIRRSEPVLENQQCYLMPDVPGLNEVFDCCSLAVPLVITDEVIGAVVVERRGHNSVVQDDLDVLEPLSAQLAVSISNARLFEQIRQQAFQLEMRVAERTAEISEQQQRTDAILSSVADAVIVFDLNRRVTMTNPAARRLFDQHDLEMDLGRHVENLADRALAPGDESRDLTEIIASGGISLQAKAGPLLEGGEVRGTVVVLRDISRLQELDHLKDIFVSNVSHELRTPLANLKLYLSLLQQGRPERQPAYLEVMAREIERLARLINDLLQISRLQGEHRAERPQVREPVNFEVLIASVVQQNLVRAENERKELRYECLSHPLPAVYGDPDQLIRALTNLVSNAISYTPEGGRIVVRSWSESVDQTHQEWVIIEVTDTGIGIPAKELATIFDRFYRGSNVSLNIPGTGLGLAILKGIVELHQGQIEVESEEGRGSTFRLKLPILESQK